MKKFTYKTYLLIAVYAATLQLLAIYFPDYAANVYTRILGVAIMGGLMGFLMQKTFKINANPI